MGTAVVYYRNTTGERDPAASERLDMTSDDFHGKEDELSSDLVTWELTPFSQYPTANASHPSNT
jgi:hypothetical protein